MATRPTVTDLVSWVGLRANPTGDTLTALTESLASALDTIEARLRQDVLPDDVTQYPQRVRTAVLIQANRYFKRRSTPQGGMAFGDVSPRGDVDGDVELLLLGLDRLDGFA